MKIRVKSKVVPFLPPWQAHEGGSLDCILAFYHTCSSTPLHFAPMSVCLLSIVLYVFPRAASNLYIVRWLEYKWINPRTCHSLKNSNEYRGCQNVIPKETSTEVFHPDLTLSLKTVFTKKHKTKMTPIWGKQIFSTFPREAVWYVLIVWHLELDLLGFDLWLYHFLAMWPWMSLWTLFFSCFVIYR